MNKKGSPFENHYIKLGVTIFATVAACILFFFAIYRIDGIIRFCKVLLKSAEPIIIGLILSYLLIPVKKFIEKPIYQWLSKKNIKEAKAKKISVALAIAGSLLFFFVLIAIFAAILLPEVARSVIQLINNMSDYVNSFILWVKEAGVTDTTLFVMFGEYITDLTQAIDTWAKTDLIPLIQQYIGQITSGVFAALKSFMNFIIGIIVVVYVMSIQERLVGQAKKIVYALFPIKRANRVIMTFRKANEIFSGFILGKIVDSAIIGVICYFGCLILRIPSPVLIAVIVGVTNVIPFFGPFIGAIPSVLIVLIQSPIHGLYLAIFILVLQQVDGNIIGPKILGDRTGLTSFWVLFAILVAGGLFGFFGMLLGVPVFAVIYYLIQEAIRQKMKERDLTNASDAYVNLSYIDEESREMIYPQEMQQIKSEKKEGEKAPENKAEKGGEA